MYLSLTLGLSNILFYFICRTNIRAYPQEEEEKSLSRVFANNFIVKKYKH